MDIPLQIGIGDLKSGKTTMIHENDIEMGLGKVERRHGREKGSAFRGGYTD